MSGQNVEDDGYSTFRAAHPQLGDALAQCERVDWLIRLAWDGGLDKRAVIREGADGLGLLFKPLIAGALRRQAARLDEASAFKIILRQLQVGMRASPARVSRVVTVTGRAIRTLVR